MKIGVVSDTHGYYDPRLAELLREAETIIHAGDVGSQDVLEALSLIAPVEAVQGNVDSPDLRLPLTRVLLWEAVQVELLHILPVSQAQLERWPDGLRGFRSEGSGRARFLRSFHPATRVIVFGHSHQPCLRILEARLFLNPGSAGKKRFSLPRCCAVMNVSVGCVDVKILSLEDYNQSVPESVELTFGE
jgi:putative phosphoesterase